ncbi:MAG: NUDIX hydrolase [Butyrivibrio sp.]|jgi:ADP-ribose pyrophosphatase|uniref:ADP-ribose pyrophosphatase n=1 Tax=Butyrivibrio hungatei TaxID=185008 RepID=A0A1G5E3Y0_9FIRM|nr:NUDIX hydrolase [Butyrivibrio hungatei]MBQ4220347.1 NUDIX hydrolase [Butyrivibrio sp.]MBR4357410.1 NUDIX hydrolase [Butyrivibrio sp.]MCR4998132.1 NUDIX hydrolase [Butyrivibrio sp.]MEE3471760.1 NUDIX hydrolase [Butyrivibrio hungatei]SCY21744.1 ADP-ribose pyrophosphatase [Butyrivibrio hungatei]
MEFQYLEKKAQGEFITRYDLHYKTVDNKDKTYEMISRNPNLKGYDDIHNGKIDAVVLIMHDETGEKILINKEFRLAAGAWVYNFPAGLIDPGEVPEESARRELKEETGLDIISIDEWIGESYSAVGFSNEKNLCCVGKATGTFQESSSTLEEITPGWYTKKEVRELLKTQPFAARTQAYCYLWSKE